MKNNLKTSICLVLFTTLSLVVSANSLKNASDSLPYLEIKGKISKKGKPDGTYKVELLYNNIVVETKEVKDEHAFSFIMPSNRDYVVKIYKKGYATKVIGINTGLHKYAYGERYYKYEFVTEMEEILMKTIEIDSIENPLNNSGLDNKQNDFNYRRKYAKKLKALPR
jgi:hypothetical protein